MNKPTKLSLLAIAGLAMMATPELLAQHGHLNAGAASWDQNSMLNFQNGAAFVASSGYVKTMVYSNTGPFALTYNGNISLTALHSHDIDLSTGERTVPVPGSPAPGSFVVAEIASLTGPAGGAFSFWQEGIEELIVPTGTTNGAFRYELSDASLGAGTSGGDPFGHIHGRRFAINKPGVYTVGFRAVDTSTNGAGGGPIHAPSDILPVTFQAGINLTAAEPQSDRVQVTFGAMTNFLWQLEWIDSLGSTNWQPVGDPLNGRDAFIKADDLRAPGRSRFYRVKGEPVVP